MYMYYVSVHTCEYTSFFSQIQRNEVGGSCNMELEGLKRVLNCLQQQKLTTEVLVTDRHKQINKWLHESHPAITHYYDVWHVAKGNNSVYDCKTRG